MQFTPHNWCAYHIVWLKCLYARVTPSSCHPWWAFDRPFLVASSFCLSVFFSVVYLFSSTLYCTLTCTPSSMWVYPTFLEIVEKRCFFCAAGRVEERPFQKFLKKHGVVSGRIGSFFYACFQSTIFLELQGVASALFHVTQSVSRISILQVWLGTKRIRCDFDTLQNVSVRFVMFCVKKASNVFLWCCVLFWHFFSLMVWSLLRVNEINKSDSLFTHVLFCWLLLCCGQFWSQHWFQTMFQTQNTLPWQSVNTVNPALPSSPSPPSRFLASTPPQENVFFFRWSQEAPFRASWTTKIGFPMISGSASQPVLLDQERTKNWLFRWSQEGEAV